MLIVREQMAGRETLGKEEQVRVVEVHMMQLLLTCTSTTDGMLE